MVICDGDSELLSTVNTNVRTIDLLCNLAAPLLVGQLLSFTSHLVTAITIGVWNIVSAVLEFILLRYIYRSHPALKMKKISQSQSKKSSISTTWHAWVAYFKHPVRDAGLGLAFLFMTVLGFDSITFGFCMLQGVSESFLGIGTAMSAFVGVVGARAFPYAKARIGFAKTGMIGFALYPYA